MKKVIAAAFGAVALMTGLALAADDPIKVRKIIMQGNGSAAGLAGAMMKGELEYNAAAAKASISSLRAGAHSFGDYFPEGSLTGDTTASPKIAEDAAGWQEALAKFIADTDAAAEASGKDGPADLEAFKAAVGPVLANCKSCHEGFRVKK